VEEEEISFMETHGNSNSIPFEADISRGRLHHKPSGYITMEWRVQQHASKAVESTASSATSTIQTTSLSTSLSAGRMKKNMEEIIPDWKLIKPSKRAHFSNTLQELMEAATILLQE